MKPRIYSCNGSCTHGRCSSCKTSHCLHDDCPRSDSTDDTRTSNSRGPRDRELHPSSEPKESPNGTGGHAEGSRSPREARSQQQRPPSTTVESEHSGLSNEVFDTARNGRIRTSLARPSPKSIGQPGPSGGSSASAQTVSSIGSADSHFGTWSALSPSPSSLVTNRPPDLMAAAAAERRRRRQSERNREGRPPPGTIDHEESVGREIPERAAGALETQSRAGSRPDRGREQRPVEEGGEGPEAQDQWRTEEPRGQPDAASREPLSSDVDDSEGDRAGQPSPYVPVAPFGGPGSRRRPRRPRPGM